jgi:hypothetical protein
MLSKISAMYRDSSNFESVGCIKNRAALQQFQAEVASQRENTTI